jgi:hypothetical protein
MLLFEVPLCYSMRYTEQQQFWKAIFEGSWSDGLRSTPRSRARRWMESRVVACPQT